MNRIGVVAALPAEARCLTRQFQSAGTISTPSAAVMVGVSGIGPTAAVATAQELLDQGCDGLISWGCAAGLSADARAGTIYLPVTIIERASGQSIAVDTTWHKHLTAALDDAGVTYQTGPLISVDRPLTNSNSKQQLHHDTGAATADMESAAIAALAAEHQLPYLCIRAVADDQSSALPPAILATLDAHGRPRLAALLRALLGQPGLVIAMLSLAVAFGRARRSLAQISRITNGRGLSPALNSRVK